MAQKVEDLASANLATTQLRRAHCSSIELLCLPAVQETVEGGTRAVARVDDSNSMWILQAVDQHKFLKAMA